MSSCETAVAALFSDISKFRMKVCSVIDRSMRSHGPVWVLPRSGGDDVYPHTGAARRIGCR